MSIIHDAASVISGMPNALQAVDEARRLAPFSATQAPAIRDALAKHGIPQAEIDVLLDDSEPEGGCHPPVEGEQESSRPEPEWAKAVCGVVTDVRANDQNGRFSAVYSEHTVISLLKSIANPPANRIATIEKVRAAQGKAARSKLKINLPAAIWAGRIVGEHRRIDNFTHPTGVVFVDVDSDADGKPFTPEQAAEVRDRVFENDRRIHAAWVSASGEGAHFLMRFQEPTADRASYAAVYEDVSASFLKRHGVRCDSAVKHPERVCYLSWDPDLRINEHGETLVPVLDIATGVAVDTATDVYRLPDVDLDKRIEAALAAIPRIPFQGKGSGTRNWQLGVVGALSGYVEGDSRVFTAICNALASAGRDASDGLFTAKWWNEHAGDAPGAFITAARVHGCEIPRRKSGRPRDEEPSPEAKRMRSRRLNDAIALEEGLDDLRLYPFEQMEQRRAFKFHPDKFLRVIDTEGSGGACYVLQRGGLWRPIERRKADASAGTVAHIVEQARTDAIVEARRMDADATLVAGVELEWHDGVDVFERNRLCEFVSQTVSGNHRNADAIKVMHSGDFNQRDARPVIPLITGGAHDLRTKLVITADELSTLHQRDIGWAVPAPMPEDIDAQTPAAKAMKREIETRYRGLAERTACLLCGMSKAVDVVKGVGSSIGKTLWYELVSKAFPGVVTIMDAKAAFGVASKRFTPIAAAQAHSLLVVLDEVGHMDRPIAANDVNALTGNKLTVELKGLDITTTQRVGNVVLVGHDWPKLKVDAQGVSTRITWAHEFAEDLGPMPQHDRDLLMNSPDAHAYLRAWLLEHACRLLNDQRGPWRSTITPESTQAVKRFFIERRDTLVQWLLDSYVQDESAAPISTASIIAAVKDELGKDEAPTAPALVEAIKQAFPTGVKTGQRCVVDGSNKRVRCVVGLKSADVGF